MRKVFFITLCLHAMASYAQDTVLLNQQLRQEKSVRNRIMMIDTVAYKLMLHVDKDSLAEDYGQEALAIAEQSGDKELMALALHRNARRCWWDGTNKTFRNERFHFYINSLIRLAKQENLALYESAAYHLLGNFHLIQYNHADCLRILQHALLIADELGNDSLKAAIYGSLGAAYSMAGDKIVAYKNFMLGLQLAERINNDYVAGSITTELAKFFVSIGDTSRALHNHALSSQYFEKNRKHYFEDYFWARMNFIDLHRALKNFQRSRQSLEELLEDDFAQVLPSTFVANVRFAYYVTLFEEKKYDEAEAYFNEHKDIGRLVSTWQANYIHDYLDALRFKEAKQYDSAAIRFERFVLPSVDDSPLGALTLNYYVDYAGLLLKIGRPEEAVATLEKKLPAAKKINMPEVFRDIYKQLHISASAAGDYKKAYAYLDLFQKYTDSIASLGKQRELMQLEVESETARLEKKRLAEAAATRTRHNLQYMAITVAIATVFAALVMLGVLTTSAAVIKALGFFAFIMLFEFIILLSDNFIHHITHGEPWQVLAIKIGLIAILFPFHHYIEKRIVNQLINSKKINIRKLVFPVRKKQEPQA